MTPGRQEFERMYATHYDAVYRYCLRRTGRDEVPDVVADTFLVAWRRRDDVPEGAELPWLYGVAGRTLANYRRSLRRRASFIARGAAADGDTPSPEVQVVRSEEEEAVRAALDGLRPADQEIIRLAAWERLTRDDIAVALGCTPNAATQRLDRALDRLGSQLGSRRARGQRFFERSAS
jgi:RNA polymerase sigma-70 factor (ECF subfamily)